MDITKEMLIEEFKRQIDFARFTKCKQTSPFRAEFLHFAIQYILDLEDENKRLRKSYKIAVQDNADTCQLLFKAEGDLKQIKTRTVMEMARRLKNAQERQDGMLFDLVSFETIDRIAQEMIGEAK